MTQADLKLVLNLDPDQNTINSPLYNIFNYALESRNMELLKLLYEHEVISLKLIDEQAFFMIYELLLENSLLNEEEFAVYIKFILTSKTTN